MVTQAAQLKQLEKKKEKKSHGYTSHRGNSVMNETGLLAFSPEPQV